MSNKHENCKHKIIRHEPQTVDDAVVNIAVVCELCNAHIGNITPEEK